MVKEVITEWTGPQGSGMRSVMYFSPTQDAVFLRDAVRDLWVALQGNIHTQYSWRISPEVRELDTATGVLVDVENDSTNLAGAGTGSGTEPAADATQTLIRWKTNTIVNGRRLQGRTFLPGPPANSIDNGNLAGFAQTGINGALATWLSLGNPGNEMQVWHRPQNGAGGVAGQISAGVAWSEFAVLRRRRR